MSQDENEVWRVAEQIQAHFAENPLAAESLEGIASWWLLQQRFEEAWITVSNALDLLVEKGVLTRTENAGGNPVYSMSTRPRDAGE